jgi:hypothetical protein
VPATTTVKPLAHCVLSGFAVRNFTLFVPTDEAIQTAFRSGALNYPYLYAKNATLLEGIVAYHAVPQYQFAGPSRQTLSMKTLLTEVSEDVRSSSSSSIVCGDGCVICAREDVCRSYGISCVTYAHASSSAMH